MRAETLHEQLLFCTVRIETTTSVGTGFLVSYPGPDDTQAIFLVTNKHVLEGAQEAEVFFTLASDNRQEPQVGSKVPVLIEDLPNQWLGHARADVDVAALPISGLIRTLDDQGTPPFLKTLNTQANFASPEQIKELDSLEDITFVGYPNGIFDEINLLPVTRGGRTATPVAIDYAGLPAFLIDASVFPGSSGSPVLLLRRGGYASRAGATILAPPTATLLGIIASVFFQQDHGEIVMRPAPTALMPIVTTRQMIDLGVVFKARTIVETIESLLRERGEIT